MSWRELLQKPGESVVSPWVGGRSLQTFERTWKITGALPEEHGWFTFEVEGRKARCLQPIEAPFDALRSIVVGFMVGDRLVPEGTSVAPGIEKVVDFPRVHLLEPGLDRFVRVRAGEFWPKGPLFYEGQEMPLGPEDEVKSAYLDRASAVNHVAGVVPALDAAFRVESWRRERTELARLEAERAAAEELALQALQQRRQELTRALGDGAGRRAMAQVDFAAAATAALAIGGATLLDHRSAYDRHEMVVQFRFRRRRFECTCDRHSLRVIDSGICLTDHESGRKDDNLLTLESLPAVIGEAMDTEQLVVFRHAD